MNFAISSHLFSSLMYLYLLQDLQQLGVLVPLGAASQYRNGYCLYINQCLAWIHGTCLWKGTTIYHQNQGQGQGQGQVQVIFVA